MYLQLLHYALCGIWSVRLSSLWHLLHYGPFLSPDANWKSYNLIAVCWKTPIHHMCCEVDIHTAWKNHQLGLLWFPLHTCPSCKQVIMFAWKENIRYAYVIQNHNLQLEIWPQFLWPTRDCWPSSCLNILPIAWPFTYPHAANLKNHWIWIRGFGYNPLCYSTTAHALDWGPLIPNRQMPTLLLGNTKQLRYQ